MTPVDSVAGMHAEPAAPRREEISTSVGGVLGRAGGAMAAADGLNTSRRTPELARFSDLLPLEAER